MSAIQNIVPLAAFTALAKEVKSAISATGGHNHVRLTEGLEIVMQRTSSDCRRRWRLALAREQIYPSLDEVDSCRQAFAVPTYALERRLERCRAHPKTGRRIHYHVVELTWLEQDMTA